MDEGFLHRQRVDNKILFWWSMDHNILKQRAFKLGLRGGDLAALANLSGPKLSNFFRGRINLDAMKRKDLVEVLDDLEKLKEYFPILIGVHDPKQTAVMLQRFRTGKFTSYLRLTRSINWSEPEGLNRTFPKLFKDSSKTEGLNLPKFKLPKPFKESKNVEK
jgi:hypothetical protein